MQLKNSIFSRIEDICEDYPIKDLKRSAVALSEDYRNEEGTRGNFIKGEIDAVAYIAARSKATYSAVEKAAEALVELSDKPLDILDIGAGPGTASGAVSGTLGIMPATLIEPSPDMISVGKKLFFDYPFEWVLGDVNSARLNPADLVISSYMFNEVTNRLSLAERLFNLSKKYLIIVDNATPKTAKMMMDIRNHLLSLGAKIVAPCMNVGVCKNEWCHFSVRVERSKLQKILKGAEAPFEDEKFTYLVFSKEETKSLPRVLRRPKIYPGFVELELCTATGVEKIKITKSDKQRFKIARKASVGDAIDI